MGVAGISFEGQQIAGFRHRLYARAMLLEDARGERIAFVVVDLLNVAPQLHRRTAELLAAAGTGIGADRLLVAATHTHAAPGNFYEVRQYNESATPVSGYDAAWVDFLVRRFAKAVKLAHDDLQPARAAWGAIRVPGVTRNRSYGAFLRNPEPRPGTVDDTLRMLRVDQCPGDRATCRARGAFSVFAVHGTGNTAVTDLMDGDVQSLVARGVERHMDSINAPDRQEGFQLGSVHLFANGASGDVSPVYDPDSRCQTHQRYELGRRPGGPRTPPAPEEWRIPEDAVTHCRRLARASMQRVGDILTRAASALYDSLGTRLSATLRVERAFTTLHLKEVDGSYPLCRDPLTGTASWGGSEDARTRLHEWKFLGLISSGIEEGAVSLRVGDNSTRCHGAKKIGLGGLQRLFVGEHGFPEYAQLSMVRVGSTLLSAVPWEITTALGARIKREVKETGPGGIEHVAIVSLTNGYVQYATTPEEYAAQHYEGGSTIYGPNTAPLIQDRLVMLASSLRQGAPMVHVGELLAYPGPTRTYLRPRTAGPPPERIDRRIESLVCSGGWLTASWIDLHPGRLVPADGQLLEIRVDGRAVAWDDHRHVEVRATKDRGSSGYEWEVHWTPIEWPEGRPELVLLARPGLDEVRGLCPGD
jgi:neutral ceramidase